MVAEKEVACMVRASRKANYINIRHPSRLGASLDLSTTLWLAHALINAEEAAKIPATILNGPLRSPLELFRGSCGIRHDNTHVTRPPSHFGCWDRPSRTRLHGCHNFLDRVTVSRAQVIGVEAMSQPRLTDSFEGGNVAQRQVADMDEVSHRRPIPGVPVGAENLEMRHSPIHHTQQARHEVAWLRPRVFTQLARCVAANGVEVAQSHDAPLCIRDGQVVQNSLAHPLGAAIRVGDRRAAALRYLLLSGSVCPFAGFVGAMVLADSQPNLGSHFSVDTGRRGENERLNVEAV